jgi:hypothetical protein
MQGVVRFLIAALLAPLISAAPAFGAKDDAQNASPLDGPVPRIVNGINTQGQASAGALLEDFSFGLGSVCSGTLIGCQTFLTAAHCVCIGGSFQSCGNPNPTDLHVFLQHVGIVPVSEIDVHPSYTFGVRNDVAVLTLAQPVSGVRPTAINTTGTPPEGTSGTIVGFGVSRGDMDDGGLKRQGEVVVSGCNGSVPEPAHVCWTFENPLGAPGEDSNTCSGDSGGPLFVDFGAGDVVAGVTSGGDSSLCLPTDLSFDTNVFENRTFIQSVAGSDLDSTQCGTISQVGDVDTVVIEASSSGLSSQAEACRQEIRKQYTGYVRKKLKLMQKCLDLVNRGAFAGPCPDVITAAKINKAAAKVNTTQIGKKCTDSVVSASALDGACASAASTTDVRDCILTAADAAVSAMLDAEYADSNPVFPMASSADAKCQQSIGKAMNRYVIGRLKTLTLCQSRRDKGGSDPCPDSQSVDSLAALVDKAESDIESRCTDQQVMSLNGSGTFGGSCATVSSAAALADCQIVEHDSEIDSLLDLAEDPRAAEQTSFSVSTGVDRLRVTLNAIDPAAGAPNDLDLYLKRGAPPTSADFDFSSTLGGVFEAIEVMTPSAGTWHVLVDTVAGSNVPLQLTITTFQP